MSGNIKYSIVKITESDKDRVLDFLNKFFFRDEPLYKYMQVLESPEDRCKELEDFCAAYIPQGFSLMAVDTDGKIIGVRMINLLTRERNSEKTAESVKKLEDLKNPGLRNVLTLLDHAFWETNVFKRFPDVHKVFGFKFLSVDGAYRCQGVAKALIEKTIELAKEHNIPLLRVDCTSAFSSKVMTGLGFDLIYTLPLTEYLDSHGNPIFDMKPPHTKLETFVKFVDIS